MSKYHGIYDRKGKEELNHASREAYFESLKTVLEIVETEKMGVTILNIKNHMVPSIMLVSDSKPLLTLPVELAKKFSQIIGDAVTLAGELESKNYKKVMEENKDKSEDELVTMLGDLMDDKSHNEKVAEEILNGV